MIPLSFYYIYPGFSYATVALFAVVILVMGFFMLIKPCYRNFVALSTYPAAICGLIVCIIISVAYSPSLAYSNLPLIPFYVFYGVHITMVFASPIIAFILLENKLKKQGRQVAGALGLFGKAVLYGACLYGFASVITGLALTIRTAILSQGTDFTSDSEVIAYANAVVFLFVMGWGSLVLILILFGIHFKHITAKHGRLSLIAFMVLTFVATLASTIITFSPPEINNLSAIGFVEFFFVDLMNAIALLVAQAFGHTWTTGEEEEQEQQQASKEEQVIYSN